MDKNLAFELSSQLQQLLLLGKMDEYPTSLEILVAKALKVLSAL